MSVNEFLLGALVYLAAAVISAPLAKKLGLGSVLGFLIAGAVIGPSIFGLVGSEGETVKTFAEFGVIVMLFLVGLELEPEKLWSLRKQILGLGLAQVVSVAAVIGGLAFALVAQDWREALAIGLILTLSSTAIVLQSLSERGVLKNPVGQSIFSVLLFQDISVIPILALLPLIAIAGAHGAVDGAHGMSLIANYPAWMQAIFIVATVMALIAAGRYLMRPIFRVIADTGAREIFVAFALLMVVGITLLMSLVGLSPALGAFLAGVVLADSEYRHELEMDLQPFKGLLLAIFFIAVGAGIDFALLQSAPVLLLSGLAIFIISKLAVQFGVASLFKLAKPDRSRFAFSLAQGSEFGFVLITLCTSLGLLHGAMPGLLTAVIALSMAAAPLLMMFDDKVLQPRFADGDFSRDTDVIGHDGVDAIIAGHGRFGMTIGRVLNAQGVKTVMLDLDASQVDAIRKFGFKVFYGDALRLDLLEAAGAKEAKLLIISLDDKDKILELVRIAKHNFPHLKLLVRAYDRTHAHHVIREGVAHVYREVFGSSMDLAEDALIELGRSKTTAARIISQFREHDDAFLIAAAKVTGDQKQLIELAKQSRAEIERVFAADKATKEEA